MSKGEIRLKVIESRVVMRIFDVRGGRNRGMWNIV
jgi:hypothetical protein